MANTGTLDRQAAGKARKARRRRRPIIARQSKGWRPDERRRFIETARKSGIVRQKTLPDTGRKLAQYLLWSDQTGAPRKPSPESVALYTVDLRTRCNPLSAASILKRVCAGCAILWPEADWRWFNRLARDLWTAVAPPKKSRKKEAPQKRVRLYLPVDEWPEDMREAWQSAMSPKPQSYLERYGAEGAGGDLASGRKDEGNRKERHFKRKRKSPHLWAPDRKDRMINSIGHLLGYQQRAGLGSKVTPESMESFAQDMFDRDVATRTVAIRFEDIYTAFVRIFAPQEDWEWLGQDTRLLRRAANRRGATKTAS